MDMTQAHAQSLGHLGLVAGTLKDYGVFEKVDAQLGEVSGKVSYGRRVGAMVLNGLGFSGTALYMSPHFFHDKPLSLLLDSTDLSASDLNDDCLGRCLDKIAEYGTTSWYSELALSVVMKADLLSPHAHIDSSSLSLYGDYDQADESSSPYPTYGYSKDHRPDLKQVTLQYVGLGKESLPIWMEARDGNSCDKSSFHETVKRVDEFYQAIKQSPRLCFIGDSALYNEELLSLEVDWLTRVPETYKEAKELCSLASPEWEAVSDERYQVCAYQPSDKKQRWLLVRSEAAFSREKASFLRRHEKQFESLSKTLWHCSCQTFNCEADAKKAVNKLISAKKHHYNVDYCVVATPGFSTKGRPKKTDLPDKINYKIVIEGISSDRCAIEEKLATLGRFILATNVLDSEQLSDEQMLLDYKEQSGVEQGFRFIKNDMVGLSSVYLKKPERIGALLAIMTLCLLIYGITQHKLRAALVEQQESLPDRKGKPTTKPTLLWIFMLFKSITMVTMKNTDGVAMEFVMNVEPLHQKVLLLLGKTARKIYQIPPDLQLQHIKLNQKTWLKWCGM